MAQQTAQTLACNQKAASVLGLCWEIEAEMFFFIAIKQQMGESAINVLLCEIADQWIWNQIPLFWLVSYRMLQVYRVNI